MCNVHGGVWRAYKLHVGIRNIARFDINFMMIYYESCIYALILYAMHIKSIKKPVKFRDIEFSVNQIAFF